MRNNAHLGESQSARLKRFEDNAPNESILTLLNSMDNHFNNEIRFIVRNNTAQTSLLLVGIHAAILTMSQAFFNDKSVSGYRTFLEYFMDGKQEENKFSLIAPEIHKWRNVLAHQWLSMDGYKFGYDYEMTQGWRRDEDVIYINPQIYAEQYLGIFAGSGRLWDYRSRFTDSELAEIDKRIIAKFKKE